MPRKPRPTPKPSPASRRPPFPVGSAVEVRSNDAGFRGSWFEATVTKPISKLRRYSVVYSTLVSPDGTPLEEKVHCAMVRPRPPPPRRRPDEQYALHCLVEAFHDDGWWAGVVTGLPGCGRDRYTIRFPSSREEFEFAASKIREQLQWVKGCWVCVQDQGEANGIFDVGMQVEVSRDSENYGAAWFVGTVMKVIGKKNFLVEYENVRLDGDDVDSCTLLKEIVDVQYIRPLLALKSKKFNVLDEVEAYCGDGWYAAIVVAVLPGPRYIVTSKGWKDMELDHMSIRSRYYWTNGRWLLISQGKQVKSETPRRKRKLDDFKPKSNGGKSLPCLLLISNEENCEVADGSNIVMQKEAEGTNPEWQIESLHGPERKKGKLLREHSQLEEGMLRLCSSGSESMSLRSSYSGSPIPVYRKDHRRTPKRNRNGLGEEAQLGNGKSECLMNANSSFNGKGRVADCHTKSNCFSHLPLGHDASDFTPIARWGNYEARSSKENIKMPRKKLAFRRKKTFSVDARQRQDEERTQRNKEKNQETRIINVHTSIEGMTIRRVEERTKVVTGEGNGDGVGIPNQAFSVNISPNFLPPCDHEVIECSSPNVPLFSHDDATGSENTQTVIREKTINADLSMCSISKQVDGLEYGYLTPNMDTIQLAKLLDSTTQWLPHSAANLFNDKVQEMQSCAFELRASEREDPILPTLFQADNLPNSNELVPTERTTAVDSEDASNGPNPSELSTEMIVLPFTKKSPLWELIESDAAFLRMPQQPHFRQLEKYLVELREGMAIGLMVAYANLVSEIRELGEVDSPKILEDKLKALDSLDSNGFNVQFLQVRLRKLLEIRRKLFQSERERGELKAQILERVAERERNKAITLALDKLISNWEEHLKLMRAKRASIISNMPHSDSKVLALERAARATEEAIVAATQQYNTALAAPW